MERFGNLKALAYIGIGSNLDDRTEHLRAAVRAIRSDSQIDLLQVSPVYESDAHVLPGQSPAPDFLNAVVEIRTELNPQELLKSLLEVERKFGRVRGVDRWLPRTIDIDILLFGDMSFSDDQLTVPHPRLSERRFVLEPLSDLDSGLYVPCPFDTTVAELLAACPDLGQIRITEISLY